MRKACILCFFLAVLLPAAIRVKAQTADTGRRPISLAYVDSVMHDDSLLKGLSAFIDSAEGPKTLLAIEFGAGNGFFISKNATAAMGYSTKAFFTPTITYLHKSGLGISASAYATQDRGRLSVYQGAITPSYGIAQKDWAAGVSYSRYINKDSISFGLTPLRNDIYMYGVFKKFWLEPGAAVDFSFDSYKLEQNPLLSDFSSEGAEDQESAVYNYKVHAHTMSAIITLQHDFEWFHIFSRDDHIAFTPTFNVLADASNYDISVINHLKVGMAERYDRNSTSNKTGNTSKANGFAIESAGALFDAVYTFGRFLIDPQILATYFINATPGVQSFRVSYLMNVGLVF
jgi:hypothetical protein